jgi:predicted DCC family thiol-disulfide oxidoreductase YuxK
MRHALLGRMATATMKSSARSTFSSSSSSSRNNVFFSSSSFKNTSTCRRRLPKTSSSFSFATTSTSFSSSSSSQREEEFKKRKQIKYDLKLLFDGECPLCVKEVNFLKSRNEKGLIAFVDLADPLYSPEENSGISYETGMATIHGVYKGNVMTGVEVFEKAYSCVGLGWVYSFTKVPALLTAANKVYDVWAKYRLEITGRPSLGDVLKARRMRTEEKTCAEATEGECNI